MFWEEFWFYIDIKHSVSFEQVGSLRVLLFFTVVVVVQVLETKKMNEIPRWFLGARLNYAENLLRHKDERIAIYSCSKILFSRETKLIDDRLGEGNATIRKMTFAQLNDQVRRYRAALQHVGVTKGDRVVGTVTDRSPSSEIFVCST